MSFLRLLIRTYPLLFKVCLISVLFIRCGADKPAEIVEAEKKLPEVIDFNFHVKPILSDRCYACHGPDKENQEADLRLDIPEGAYAVLASDEGRAIVPGELSQSEVYRRIIPMTRNR